MNFQSPIGQHLRFNRETGKIIGVVKDYHFMKLNQKIEPLIMSIRRQWREFIFIKVNQRDLQPTIDYIDKTWTDLAPDIPLDFNFWDETLASQYLLEQQTGKLFEYFTFIAIFISCLGLFGLASFTAEQRTKEIGIRKVLGAQDSGIVLLLSKEFTKWVLISNIIAWPIAWLAMSNWLNSFAYHTKFRLTSCIISGLLALVIAMLTVCYQSVRASRANPVDSLKYE